MTREECIALLDRYANYNGMGIPNLAGCKEAMRKAVELLSAKPAEDLKGEIREWVNLMVGASFPEQDGDYISEEDYRSVIRQTALHFYELGKQSKEPVSEELEEEIKRYIPRGRCPVPDFMEAVARHFAKWQAEKCDEETSKLLYGERQTAYINGWDDHKEQMLKDAVEAEVHYFGETQGVPRSITIPRMQEWLKPFNDRDKVKIVIVKEGEE